MRYSKPMMLNAIFIRMRRKELGLRQEDVAEHVGVSQRAVSGWESGEVMIRLDCAERLAKLLKVDITDLLVDEA